MKKIIVAVALIIVAATMTAIFIKTMIEEEPQEPIAQEQAIEPPAIPEPVKKDKTKKRGRERVNEELKKQGVDPDNITDKDIDRLTTLGD